MSHSSLAVRAGVFPSLTLCFLGACATPQHDSMCVIPTGTNILGAFSINTAKFDRDCDEGRYYATALAALANSGASSGDVSVILTNMHISRVAKNSEDRKNFDIALERYLAGLIHDPKRLSEINEIRQATEHNGVGIQGCAMEGNIKHNNYGAAQVVFSCGAKPAPAP